MYTAENRSGEVVPIQTLHIPDSLPAPDQPRSVSIRGLVRQCHQLSQQYRETPETCRERGWWRQFNQAGIQLRQELERAKEEGYPGLSDQEIEQAYFQLIHVAHFFAPGGVAETVWLTLPPEPEDRQAKMPGSEAFAVVFGVSPQEVLRASVFSRLLQRLNLALGRNAPCNGELVEAGAQDAPEHMTAGEGDSASASSGAREAT